MGKIFSFNGRINRGEYAITFACYVGFYIFYKIMVLQNPQYATLGLLYIPLVYILWAQGAKRCHDINKNGWWQLIPFYFIALLSTRGTDGPNQYDGGTAPHFGADDYEKPFDIDEDVPAPVPVVESDPSKYMPK